MLCYVTFLIHYFCSINWVKIKIPLLLMVKVFGDWVYIAPTTGAWRNLDQRLGLNGKRSTKSFPNLVIS